MRERILIVDDEDAVALTLSVLLDREGYHTLTAHDLGDAAARLDHERFDAIVLDLMLDGEDGLKVLAHLRESSPDTAAIVLTGYGTLESATRAIQFGVSEYLTKPGPVEDLKSAVARALARRREIVGARREIEDERARLLVSERAARAVAELWATRATRLQEVTAALSGAVTVADVGQAITREAVRATGATAGALGIAADDGATMILAGVAGYEPVASAEYARFPVDGQVPMADALRARAPIWIADLAEFTARYPHLHAPPERARLAALPLDAGDRVLGAVSLSFPDARDFDPAEREFLLALARECTRALERARLTDDARSARLQAEDAQRRQAFLAEASRILGSSLEEEEVLTALARLAVPVLGDWCTVDLLDETGTLRRVVVVAADPAHESAAREIRAANPPNPAGDQGVPRALREGQAIVYPEIPDALLRANAQDDHQYQLYQSLGLHAALIVPLVARGRTIGTLTWCLGRSDREYADADVSLAEDVARRVALALDNARLFRQARDAVKLRDEFLSIAAHELKTPLTGLRGSAQLLGRMFDRPDEIPPERLHQRVAAIVSQAERLGRLVEQLLDVSRLAAGRLNLDPSPTDLTALVHSVVAAAQTRTERHAIQLDTPAATLVSVDALRFEQVVQNLLDNAIKYSPGGGAIEVVVEATSPAEVAIAVTDHGLGVQPEHRAHIFDRFYQAHAGSHYGGMGLGLFISKQIVELHGGTLTAEFPEDGGSRFIVRLPNANGRATKPAD